MEDDISLIVKRPDQDRLASLFKEQGDYIRKLKADAEVWQEDRFVLDEVWRLLALKTFDPELGAIPVEHRGPFTLKIRWKEYVNEELGEVRFQNVIKNRFYLSGEEVFQIISKHINKPNISSKFTSPKGGPLKIQQVIKGDKTKNQPDQYIALTNKSVVKMPLSFPGPWLASTGTLEFKVIHPGPKYHYTTPSLYNNHLPELIDAGANLFSKEFTNLGKAIDRSFAAGVSQIVTISVNLETSQFSVDLANKYVHSVYATVGIHPLDVMGVPLNEESLNTLKNLIKKNKRGIVAIGECGIDHEKQRESQDSQVSTSDFRKMQVKWFEAQIELAIEFDLPILLHQRGGYEDCIQTLAKYRNKNLKLIVNCFNGTPEEMKGYIDVSKDCYFVVTGLVCHEERGRSLRTAVKFIPLERLLIATDAPHLIPHNMPPPQPRRCEPGFLSHVLVFLSELLGMPFEELARITTSNSRKAYNLSTPLYNGETTRGELVFTEFQKDEDNALKAPKNIKVPPTVIPLEENQHVFELKMEDGSVVAYIVNEKEKGIMEKQKASKTAKQLTELAETIELKAIPPNSKLCKGETEIYSTVAVKPKKVPEKKAPKKKTAPKRRNKPRK